jgi:aconitate hydratase
MNHNLFNSLQDISIPAGRKAKFYSLPALETAGLGKISRLPVSIRIVLESVLRNCDGDKITEAHVKRLADWKPNAARMDEIPFVVSRIVLQDFTGVPLLVDLAAMRSVAQRMGKDPKLVEPLVPVDLVVDHSVQVDHYGDNQALEINMEFEFRRNNERYQFIKWGMQAFDTFKVVPPGIGIVHQVNLEYLARGVHVKDGLVYPDTLVGTDSHTTMINGIGVVGWGVGGIEAEAGMLGQPVYFLTPDVVGVNLTGRLRAGVTATDLVLTVTEMLRKANVVGAFVEFFGEGTASLTVPDRATIANMSPEYGATMGFFPVDDATIEYFRGTGRSDEEIAVLQSYFKAQELYGMPHKGDIDYTRELELDLNTVAPSLAGPRRPQDRIELGNVKSRFVELFAKPVVESGYGRNAADLEQRYSVASCSDNSTGGEKDSNKGIKAATAGEGRDSAGTAKIPSQPETAKKIAEMGNNLSPGSARNLAEMVSNRPILDVDEAPQCISNGPFDLGHGDVLIAAITSCTNTSNPSVLLAAGLLAKKAVEKGLTVKRHIKTSLAPGSRVVTEYLTATGLMPYLEKLGFNLAGYGCTTCIGNSGPLSEPIEEAVVTNDLVCAAVLSGNRNFEARIHPNIRANFLASPPLVVAYAIAGTTLKNLTNEPLGIGEDGKPVWLSDIWPSDDEVRAIIKFAADAEAFRRLYSNLTKDHVLWNSVPSVSGQVYIWPESTYIAEPPFFQDFSMDPAQPGGIRDARTLAIFGDSVTTDHISPAGSIKDTSPAGKYLLANGVSKMNFNSYGARRGNHEVMMRGTFANVRIKNLMIPGSEGGITLHQPDGERMSIYDAAMRYIADGVSTVVFGGEEYGTGSSRDWAAKGTQLLGVKAVIAKSFERIHRSNLVGMGVLPLQFKENDSVQSLGIKGDEQFDLLGLSDIRPQQNVSLVIRSADGSRREVDLLCRIDTAVEVDYYMHGGILPYVLRHLMTN